MRAHCATPRNLRGTAGSSQMPKMLLLPCFLNEIVKSLEKNLMFLRAKMTDCDAGALRNPAQPGGDGWELPDAKNVKITMLFERKREKS